MEGLLDHDSPLYGRATYRPVLEPLDYRKAAGFSGDDEPECLLRRFRRRGRDAAVPNVGWRRTWVSRYASDGSRIARNGFTDRLRDRAEHEDVLLRTASDLFTG